MVVKGRDFSQFTHSAADIAVRLNDMEMLKFLQECESIFLVLKDNAGYTPWTTLSKACQAGKAESVRILLACPDILIDRRIYNGKTALHCAA